jgi:hypothetical protein
MDLEPQTRQGWIGGKNNTNRCKWIEDFRDRMLG